jgi:hypothetical protein
MSDLQQEATAKAVAIAQSMALGLGVAPISKLTTEQWGLIVSAAIFEWLRARSQQAVTEGIDPDLSFAAIEPSPRVVAIVEAILPRLADEVAIDWDKSLMSWSGSEMVEFLMAARRLFAETETTMKSDSVVRERKERKMDELNDAIPSF